MQGFCGTVKHWRACYEGYGDKAGVENVLGLVPGDRSFLRFKPMRLRGPIVLLLS